MTTLIDIGQTVAKFAPVIGGLLGGPAGAAVGSIVAAKFGGNTDDLDDLNRRIIGDPEAQIKCLQIQSDNEIQLQTLTFTAENNRLTAETNQMKIQADAMADTRAREVELAKAGKPDDTPKILALSYTFCYFLVMAIYSIFPALKDQNIITALSAGEMVVLGYYFGSSASSRKKDETILLASQNK